MYFLIRLLVHLTALTSVAGTAQAASTQTFPEKPLRLIVGLAPGSTTDLAARIIAQGMSKSLGLRAALAATLRTPAIKGRARQGGHVRHRRVRFVS